MKKDTKPLSNKKKVREGDLMIAMRRKGSKLVTERELELVVNHQNLKSNKGIQMDLS